MSKLLSAAAAASLVAMAALSGPAMAQGKGKTYELRFQSSDTSGALAFQIARDWAERVGKMSGGRIRIEMMPVGSVVEYSETLEAVGAGILQGHVTDSSYFTGKDPAFALIANPVGAWSDPNDMLNFFNYGGGREVYNQIVNPYGVQFIGASAAAVESIASRVPIDKVADLKGLKIRAPEGLVQSTFAAAGASPVNLPQSEVFTSLDKGVIEAADATTLATNDSMGLHDIAKHPLWPGFHSLPIVDISINKAIWDEMPEDLKTILTVSVNDLARDSVSRVAMMDKKVAAKLRARGDVTIHDWPLEERQKFRQIAQSQWAKFAERSPNAQKVYQALTAYLKDQGLL
ncbi:TRAP transporter substrate-binding protein [Azospirillum thermophilum]|uniref:C4-dicarboxylate ABC transporter substrate-binding protein n=1 Tax=Azospirillum thermophilum TaxID=2202148 RepID=A0A2S2CWI1_9PROT|nr:TRAP transporter substrate-binding protein [Azospirillum thermophilum]AWK88765.1 C4-dicarboxylate ABC transporter substrate-binding protein [Azospirillum thermophilum]